MTPPPVSKALAGAGRKRGRDGGGGGDDQRAGAADEEDGEAFIDPLIPRGANHQRGQDSDEGADDLLTHVLRKKLCAANMEEHAATATMRFDRDFKNPKTRLIELSEVSFRWQLNEDAMATEKLAEGIRLFSADLRSLENKLVQLMV